MDSLFSVSMNVQPSSSLSWHVTGSRVKRPRMALSATEKLMVMNVYKYVYEEKSREYDNLMKISVFECATKAADMLGISSRTVTEVIKKHEGTSELPAPPKKRGPKRNFKDKLDESQSAAIRQIVQGFSHRNELPTIKKVTQAVNADPELPSVSWETMRKIMKHLNLEYAKRSIGSQSKKKAMASKPSSKAPGSKSSRSQTECG